MIRKDVIFLLLIFLWIITLIISYACHIEYWKTNSCWIVFWTFLVLLKLSNTKFNNWLNKEL
jgi:fatty acid desaturase